MKKFEFKIRLKSIPNKGCVHHKNHTWTVDDYGFFVPFSSMRIGKCIKCGEWVISSYDADPWTLLEVKLL